MTNNFLNSEEEAELKLRINALKSASRNGHGTSHNINDEEPENEDENKLREMALKSISKDSSRKIDSKNHVSVVEKGISKHDSDDLKLRQVALKSLLQKRLLKTEDLLKKANSKVMQQSFQNRAGKLLSPKENTTKKSLMKKKPHITECIVKYRNIVDLEQDEEDINSIKETDISDLSKQCVLTSQNEDDQISLCASDNDGKDLCLSDHESLIDDLSTSGSNRNYCKDDNKAITSCDANLKIHDFQSSLLLENSCDKSQSNIECGNSLNTLTGLEPSCHSTIDVNEDLQSDTLSVFPEVSFVEDNKDCSKQKEILEKEKVSMKENSLENDTVEITVDNEDLNLCKKHMQEPDKTSSSVSSLYLEANEPGPSGYKKPCDKSYDSDAEVSIIEITPKKKSPLVIELSSDSDSTFEKTEQKKIKRKSKQKVIQEELSHQVTKSPGREDMKDSICSICLGPFENRSFLLECFHSFCHICIIQWSELSRACPLCKTKYKSLIHSVTSDLEYDQYTFPEESKPINQVQTLRVPSENMQDGRRFRYQTTLVDYQTWAQRRAERERAEKSLSLGREQRKMTRRLKWSATKDRRKAVYRLNMKVKEVKQRGRPKLRDISCEFFRENPALKHRLVPWLLRDLNVLLGDNDENIRFVMSLILNLISNVSLESEEFKKQLFPFLFKETEHFIAEFASFARSPYDIKGYDDNVVYDIPIQKKTDVHVIEDTLHERLLHEVFNEGEENEAGNTSAANNAVENTESTSEDSHLIREKSPEAPVEPEEPLEEVEEKHSEADNADTSHSKKKKKKKRKHKKSSKEESTNAVEFDVDNGGGVSVDVDVKSNSRSHKHKKHKKKHSKHKKRHRKHHITEDEQHFSEEASKRKKKKEEHVDDFDDDYSSRHCKDGNRRDRKSSDHISRKRKRHVDEVDNSTFDKEKLNKENSLGQHESEKRHRTTERKSDQSHRENSLGQHESEKRHRTIERKPDQSHKKKSKKHKSKKKHSKKKRQRKNEDKSPESNFDNNLAKVNDLRETEKKIEMLFASISRRYDLPLTISSEERKHERNNFEKGPSRIMDKKAREVRDYIHILKPEKLSVLAKDNNIYKSRVDIVRELLRVEKALVKKKDRREQFLKTESLKPTQAAADSTVCNDDVTETVTYEPKKPFQHDKTYIALMSELQEIEGRLNSCRSSFLKNDQIV